MIANTDTHERTMLSLFISDKDKLQFTKRIDLFNLDFEDVVECHYPSATEYNGKLYIIATAGYGKDNAKQRGAILFTLNVSDL